MMHTSYMLLISVCTEVCVCACVHASLRAEAKPQPWVQSSGAPLTISKTGFSHQPGARLSPARRNGQGALGLSTSSLPWREIGRRYQACLPNRRVLGLTQVLKHFTDRIISLATPAPPPPFF